MNTLRYTVQAHRAFGTARPRRRQPRMLAPDGIVREYTLAILRYVALTRAAFEQLFAELPELLASAARERQDADRADAGESKRIQALVDAARERIANAFGADELERLAGEFGSRTSVFNREQLARQTRAAFGVDVIGTDRKVGGIVEGFVAENVALIKNIPAKLADDIGGAALRAVTTGQLHSDLAKDIEARFGVARSRAKLIARDQVSKLTGQINIARQKELGGTGYIWRTSNDERVRDEHKALNGQRFEYDEPPSEGHPGEAIQCRCYAEPDFNGLIEGWDDTPAKPEQPRPVEPKPERVRKPRTPKAPKPAPKPARAPRALPRNKAQARLNDYHHALEGVEAGTVDGSVARGHVRDLVMESADMEPAFGQTLGYRIERVSGAMAKATGISDAAGYNAGTEVVVDVKSHTGASRFARNLARGETDVAPPLADAFHVMVHEEVHSMGVIRRNMAYSDHGAVIEEVATEVTARRIMREQFGHITVSDRGPIAQIYTQGAHYLPYADAISDVRLAIARELAVPIEKATELLEDAARRFKQRPGSVYSPDGMVTLFVEQIEGVDATPSVRASLIEALKELSL